MISLEDIRGLARLARLKLTSAEETQLQKDISGILEYVGQVGAVSTGASQPAAAALRNVMRDDVPSAVLGTREALIGAFPARDGDYNAVRTIIEKDVE